MNNLNHKVFNIPNLVLFMGCCATIFLLWLVFRGGVNAPSHMQEKKEIQQQQIELKAEDKTYFVDSGRWKKTADSLAVELADAHEQIDTYRKQLASGKKKVLEILGNIQDAKQTHDTVAIVQHCDSLQQQVEQQAGVISHYEFKTDEMFRLYEQRLAVKDSIIVSQAELLSHFRTANLNLESKYNTLSTDYNRVVRKAKQGRTVNRLLAAGAIVFGGLILSK